MTDTCVSVYAVVGRPRALTRPGRLQNLEVLQSKKAQES